MNQLMGWSVDRSVSRMLQCFWHTLVVFILVVIISQMLPTFSKWPNCTAVHVVTFEFCLNKGKHQHLGSKRGFSFVDSEVLE